ncbi:MAG: hypothetical protein PUA63_01885 [Oscillospiraceae bacterium]|nr:hypothetical protein [Oscillospiraceae bacterium]
MHHEIYGPRGAEEEHSDFWTDLAEGADMLPGVLPAEEEQEKSDLFSGLSAQEPYGPAAAHRTGRTLNRRDGAIVPETPLPSENDPLGSWTGVPENANEIPTQDQDDL